MAKIHHWLRSFIILFLKNDNEKVWQKYIMLHIYKINYNNYVVKQNLLLAMANWQSNRLGINCGISECYAFRENKRCAQHPFSRCNKSYPSHVHVDCHFKQCNSYPLHHRGFVRKLSLLQMFTKTLA